MVPPLLDRLNTLTRSDLCTGGLDKQICAVATSQLKDLFYNVLFQPVDGYTCTQFQCFIQAVFGDVYYWGTY